ncbi:MAG: hypothetical protein HYS12_17865 [Planctomycetes bacterium]|nr:hypothetical protein [Planctomycetota bacterium]
MSNILHTTMLRQFAAEINSPARNLLAIASLMQVAREQGEQGLVEDHWRCLQQHAQRLHDILREWEVLGIALGQLRFWEDAPTKAALVHAAQRWGSLPGRAGATAEAEEAARCLCSAALGV